MINIYSPNYIGIPNAFLTAFSAKDNMPIVFQPTPPDSSIINILRTDENGFALHPDNTPATALYVDEDAIILATSMQDGHKIAEWYVKYTPPKQIDLSGEIGDRIIYNNNGVSVFSANATGTPWRIKSTDFGFQYVKAQIKSYAKELLYDVYQSTTTGPLQNEQISQHIQYTLNLNDAANSNTWHHFSVNDFTGASIIQDAYRILNRLANQDDPIGAGHLFWMRPQTITIDCSGRRIDQPINIMIIGDIAKALNMVATYYAPLNISSAAIGWLYIYINVINVGDYTAWDNPLRINIYNFSCNTFYGSISQNQWHDPTMARLILNVTPNKSSSSTNKTTGVYYLTQYYMRKPEYITSGGHMLPSGFSTFHIYGTSSSGQAAAIYPQNSLGPAYRDAGFEGHT